MADEVFFRSQEIERTERSLPGASYNLIFRLFRRAAADCLFVPIRTMQYLAVVDDQEIIFADGAGNRSIELAWQNFQPRTRSALTDAVPYDAVYYAPGAAKTMLRLQGEFHRALTGLERRQATVKDVWVGACIVKLTR
ncbi:MAG: hypothetical protein ACYDB8_10655 [Acidiferrobacterales bacterium]